MTKLVELNYQGSRGASSYMWGLHADLCREVRILGRNGSIVEAIETDRSRHGRSQHFALADVFEANSLKEAFDYVLDAEVRSLGWNEDHVYVAPCVKRAFRKVAA